MLWGYTNKQDKWGAYSYEDSKQMNEVIRYWGVIYITIKITMVLYRVMGNVL